MQIIYGYSNCTDKKYKELFLNKKTAVLQPDQKYHSLLIRGLAASGVKVHCLSGLPINRDVTSKIWINEPDEQEENATFHYYKTLNLPILRHIMILCGAFINVLKIRKKESTFAICDCLNIANAYGITLACKLRRIPIITIVTDLPDMMNNGKVVSDINNKLFGMMDGFVFLTEQMNERINKKQRPYIVLEGHVDAELQMLSPGQQFEEVSGKKVIIYAGSIHKLYGIQNLVEGFLKADIPNTELRIFGTGDYRDELVQIAMQHQKIQYMGICSNKEVVQQEQQAALLVNPRPIAPEYTKYSFPSKNMEYMVSGTPILTTKLPGMPKEYYPYVYLLEDESSEEISKMLQKICAKKIDERLQKGMVARKFVLENKSNIAQAKKIIYFIQKEIG